MGCSAVPQLEAEEVGRDPAPSCGAVCCAGEVLVQVQQRGFISTWSLKSLCWGFEGTLLLLSSQAGF